MSKLAKIESTIPIKAIPEEELNRIILTDFLTWLSRLLSLTDEVSAERLEVALPAIKEHCWSMGFAEIKKMFEMYIDNKLSLTPKTNYFDRALLGQIVDAYKQVKPKKEFNEKQWKMNQDIIDAISHFDYFLHNKRLDTNSSWVFVYLEERGLLKVNPRQRQYAWNRAKEQLPNAKKEEQIQKAQRYLLRQYFEKLQTKGKHLKDLL